MNTFMRIFNTGCLKELLNKGVICVLVCAVFLTMSLNTNAENSNQAITEASNITTLEKFAGIYEGQDDKYVMRLGLFCEGDIIYGWHKAILPTGQRADMVNEQTISFVGNLKQDRTLKMDFISGYASQAGRGTGTAEITMVDDNTINFKIISRQGESYFPAELTLSKIEQSQNAPQYPLYIDEWSIIDTNSKKQLSFRNNVSDFIEILGPEKSTSLYLDKGTTSGIIYYYDGIEMLASNSKEDIMYFYITSDRYVISKNLKVGDGVSKLLSAYPAIVPSKAKKGQNLEIYTYVLDKSENIKSIFEVEKGIIKSIRLSYI